MEMKSAAKTRAVRTVAARRGSPGGQHAFTTLAARVFVVQLSGAGRKIGALDF